MRPEPGVVARRSAFGAVSREIIHRTMPKSEIRCSLWPLDVC